MWTASSLLITEGGWGGVSRTQLNSSARITLPWSGLLGTGDKRRRIKPIPTQGNVESREARHLSVVTRKRGEKSKARRFRRGRSWPLRPLWDQEAGHGMGRRSKRCQGPNWTEGTAGKGEGEAKSGRKRRGVKHRAARTERCPFSGTGSQMRQTGGEEFNGQWFSTLTSQQTHPVEL